MATDQSAPATKLDIQMLMEQMGSFYDRVEKRFAEHEYSIRLHFDVVVEHLRAEIIRGAHADKLSVHDDVLLRHDIRITALERGR